MSVPVVLTVTGTPAPQGSKRHVGGGRMVEMSRNVKPWREAVKAAALESGCGLLYGPVRVDVTFYLKRPAGHYGTGRNAGTLKGSAPRHPKVKPDIDKLARSTLDGLTGVLLADDAQVIQLAAAKKYAPAAQRPGAVIRITELEQK